jgi:hypothetical protein
MKIEEMLDYCKTLFSDQKFNDLIVKFCKEPLSISPSKVAGEGKDDDYVCYVDEEKVERLDTILTHLP